MAGLAGFGTVLKIGGTAGTAIVNVTNIEGPNFSADMLDMTAHDSPSAWREFEAGLLDAGELTLRLNWEPAENTHSGSHASGVLKALTGRASKSWALQFPDAGPTIYQFTGFVRQFSGASPHDDKMEATVTIKLTGAPTLA